MENCVTRNRILYRCWRKRHDTATCWSNMWFIRVETDHKKNCTGTKTLLQSFCVWTLRNKGKPRRFSYIIYFLIWLTDNLCKILIILCLNSSGASIFEKCSSLVFKFNYFRSYTCMTFHESKWSLHSSLKKNRAKRHSSWPHLDFQTTPDKSSWEGL